MQISFVLVDDQPLVRVMTGQDKAEFKLNVKVEVDNGKVINEDQIKSVFDRILQGLKNSVAEGKSFTQKEIDNILSDLSEPEGPTLP